MLVSGLPAGRLSQSATSFSNWKIKLIDMKFYLGLCALSVFVGHQSVAQHDHHSTPAAKLEFASVMNTILSDPELKDFRLQSSLMTVPPTLVDTVSHRHDAELFGYVVEGAVEIGLEHKQPTLF